MTNTELKIVLKSKGIAPEIHAMPLRSFAVAFGVKPADAFNYAYELGIELKRLKRSCGYAVCIDRKGMKKILTQYRALEIKAIMEIEEEE